jgi:hypothetical protein
MLRPSSSSVPAVCYFEFTRRLPSIFQDACSDLTNDLTVRATVTKTTTTCTTISTTIIPVPVPACWVP